MNFGPQTNERDSHAIMDRALELGINFFDTANVYGQRKGVGVTEKIVGDWFAKGDGRRDKVVLATKVYGEMGSWPNESRLSALHIRQRVRREPAPAEDRPHRPVPDAPHLPAGRVGRDLAGDRDARAAGQGPLRRLEQLRGVAHREGERGREGASLPRPRVRAVHLQPRRAGGRVEVLPACEDYGMGVIPWSPLWRGLLAGVLDAEGGRRSSSMVQEALERWRPQVEAYEKFCAELGRPPAEVGLAWVLANPVVTAPIVGPRTMDQLEGAMRALDLTLDDATMKRLDEIWPGPGGPAPESYAW